MFPKMASLKENSEQLSGQNLLSSEVRPLPFPPFPRVRAPNDILTITDPQMHVHDLVSTLQ